jgi:hypothetical protein
VVVPTGNVDPGLWLADDDASAQLSVAAGGVQDTTASHDAGATGTVIFPGHPVIVGASVSRTRTSKEQVAVLPPVLVNV